jgi:type IV pilus assembly protein PilB
MAVTESKKTGVMLGDVLLRLDWVTQEQLQMSLAVQSGAKLLDTEAIKVDPGLIAQVPQEFVTTHGIMPLQKRDNTILAATNNPFDVVAKDKLARITGCQVETYIASKEWLNGAIELYYKTALAIDADIDRVTRATVTDAEFEENQIVLLGDRLIEKGLVLGASDIHVVPDVKLSRIYYRIDGVLQQKFLFPIRFHKAWSPGSRSWRTWTSPTPTFPTMDASSTGDIGDLDIRVSTFPTHLGETVVMRLLVYSKVVGDLRRLGLEESDFDIFLKNIQRPYGLIVATGPTGSGKTTTLYSALMTVNSPNINVMTVEDPIEYVIPTIRQTAVNPKAGLTFGNALRSAMRQDPDIILVGEIRDTETADLALRASMTGHLVFSTLHTNDAASAINRLLDLGVSKGILASSLSMVIAQRLVRKICTNCCDHVAPTEQSGRHCSAARHRPAGALVVPVGCDSCYQAGYRGRTGIYEVIRVDKKIQSLIFAGALHSTIEEAAVKAGTSLMLKQALKKAAAGLTSFEEVYRVVADA